MFTLQLFMYPIGKFPKNVKCALSAKSLNMSALVDGYSAHHFIARSGPGPVLDSTATDHDFEHLWLSTFFPLHLKGLISPLRVLLVKKNSGSNCNNL